MFKNAWNKKAKAEARGSGKGSGTPKRERKEEVEAAQEEMPALAEESDEEVPVTSTGALYCFCWFADSGWIYLI